MNATITCPSCESPVKEDSRFCENCGAAIQRETGQKKPESPRDSKIIAYEKALGNKYRILKKIGAGGFAEVYLGEHATLGRKVAIKILHGSWAGQDDMVERFRRESKAAAKLSHPNIIDIYDVGDSDGIYYFVMKYVDGETLAHKLFREKRIAPGEAISIVRQVADALGYAHEHDVIHRDIKPANVMIDPYGKPVLMDFGIARVQFEGNLTKTGTLMGTPNYLPPEQPLGKRVDGRSDIYSLGIVFYEMLVGRPPFNDENSVSLIFKHINEVPPRLEDLNPDLHPDLCSVVYRMIEKLPESRYQSAMDVVEALDPLVAIYPPATPSRRSSGSGGKNTEQLLSLARENLQQQKFDRAIEIYGTVLKRNPDNPIARKSVEDMLEIINQRMMEHAEKNEFSEAKALLLQIQKLPIGKERMTTIRSGLEAAEHKYFKDTELRSNLDEARAALQHDNASAAIDRLTRALTISPEHPEAQDLLRKARAAHETKRQKAEYANAYSEAEYYFNSRSYDQALLAVKRALEIDGTPEALELQEKILASSKQKAYRQAEQERIFTQVDEWCENLDFDAAREVLEQGRDMFPVPVQFKRAVVDRAQGFYEKFANGRQLFTEGKWQEARAAFEDFLGVPQPYDFRVFYRLKKEAESHIKQCGELMNSQAADSLEANRLLKKADVLVRMGMAQQARDEVQRLLESEPNNTRVSRKLSEIEALLAAKQQQQVVERPEEPSSVMDPPELDPIDLSHTVQVPASSRLPVLPAPASVPEEQRDRQQPPPPSLIRKQPGAAGGPYRPAAAPPLPQPAAVTSAPVRGSRYLYLLVGGFVAVAFLLALVLLLRTPTRPVPETTHSLPPQEVPAGGNTPPTAASAAPVMVSIDALPWANAVITSAAGDETLTIQTPAVVQLLPGQYVVEFKNPQYGTFSKVIRVQPGNTHFSFSFDQMNADKLADSLINR